MEAETERLSQALTHLQNLYALQIEETRLLRQRLERHDGGKADIHEVEQIMLIRDIQMWDCHRTEEVGCECSA